MGTDIKVRNIDFKFDDNMDYNWNPGNPAFAALANVIFFMAPGFEKYFIRAIRESMKRISDPLILEEADLFCRQEAIHSKVHREHIGILAKKYPGLDKVRDRVVDLYDQLFEEESLDFHLAYAAIGEGTFSPGARFIIENRNLLFKNPDPRIASFFIWHMVEEYEHRSSAVNVYNEIVGSYWYKLKCLPKVAKHLWLVGDTIAKGVDECVGPLEGGVMPSEIEGFAQYVPFKEKRRVIFELLRTVLPGHDPEKETLPEWAVQWFKDEESGMDMSNYYPTVSR